MANVSKFAPKLASILSSLLERTTKKYDATIQTESETSLFHGQSKPDITIRAYVERIFRLDRLIFSSRHLISR
ncbi:Cyclin-U4-1 [Carex littledalei]|uniref:Cyclin-U4-1 n=1 Tax=Carex littledalei TaxID=544730 RepID=A0A833RB34_9POAL|nr:Cyclin-U4-1 [Carex littledalei]